MSPCRWTGQETEVICEQINPYCYVPDFTEEIFSYWVTNIHKSRFTFMLHLNIARAFLLCPFPSCWPVCLGSCQVLGNSALYCMLTADCCSSGGRGAILELKLEAGLWACLVKTLSFPLSCLPHLPFCLCSPSDQRALEGAMLFRPAVLYKRRCWEDLIGCS